MVSYNPMVREITRTAPRIRVVDMGTKRPRFLNRLFGPGTMMIMEDKPTTFTIAGEMTSENVGREIIAQLMRGDLGRYISASDDNRDCILGLTDAITVDGKTVTLPVCVMREPH